MTRGKSEPHQGRLVRTAATGGESQVDRRRIRMEEAAIDLLEKVLRRSRWTAVDKDRIAEYLDRLVGRELKREKMRGQGDD